MDILEANLENRITILEAKVAKIAAILANFQSFVHAEFSKLPDLIDSRIEAKLAVVLANGKHKEEERSEKPPNLGTDCSRSSHFIKSDDLASDFNLGSKLLIQESTKESVSVHPCISQCTSEDRITTLMKGAVKRQEFQKLQVNEILDLNVALGKSMELEEGLVDFNEKQRLIDVALKLFVEMPKQEMCEVLLDRISFYGINEFPFDPGIPTADHDCEYMASELLINDCHAIAFMLILLGLKKLQHLEVLSVGGFPTVYDDFVRKYIIDCGHSLKETCLKKEASVAIDERVYCPHIRCSVLMSKDEVLEYTRPWGVGVERSGSRKCVKCQSFQYKTQLDEGSGDIMAVNSSIGILKCIVSDCHSSGVSAISFAVNGSCIYTAGKDGMICEIDPLMGTFLENLWELMGGKKRSASCVLAIEVHVVFLDCRCSENGLVNVTGLYVLDISEACVCYIRNGQNVEDLQKAKPTEVSLARVTFHLKNHKGASPPVFAAKLIGIAKPTSGQVFIAYGLPVKPQSCKLLVHSGKQWGYWFVDNKDGLMKLMHRETKWRIMRNSVVYFFILEDKDVFKEGIVDKIQLPCAYVA